MENNRADAVVYKYALKRFRREYSKHKKYTLALFEKKHVLSRIAELSPVRFGREFVFDMNMGFVETGFHQREGSLTCGCVRWSGPETQSHIYMRVPRGKDLRIRIYNKGWMDWSARGSLVIEVDGDVRPYSIENAPRMAEIFVVEARSTKRWLRVTTRIASTVSDADMGLESGDDRKKGFAIWGYGYEIVDRPVELPARKRAQAKSGNMLLWISATRRFWTRTLAPFLVQYSWIGARAPSFGARSLRGPSVFHVTGQPLRS